MTHHYKPAWKANLVPMERAGGTGARIEIQPPILMGVDDIFLLKQMC